jgi:hypothetical protein
MAVNWTTVTAIVGAVLGVWNFVQGLLHTSGAVEGGSEAYCDSRRRISFKQRRGIP